MRPLSYGAPLPAEPAPVRLLLLHSPFCELATGRGGCCCSPVVRVVGDVPPGRVTVLTFTEDGVTATAGGSTVPANNGTTGGQRRG